ncbi:unnamed protein product [Mytilus edulis]|uniref:Uncharacterized protein n=1 Tax=Mytilus edulis TaxID=6550 RepID=A0A8S3UPT8_MYTED|nr:unnamed protein product [Mytilus edulis]
MLEAENSRFQPGKKTFSPYLRIYPHQNTTFLRYTDHWIKILKFVLENKIDDLRNLLSKFIDDEQTQVNILYDKDTISSFKRSVTDVSSEVKQGIIVEHRCRFQVPFHHGQIIQIQMSASMNRGFLTPSPQILDVTENIKFCIDHFDNPIKTLLRYAKLHTKPKYSSVDDYIRTWIPIVEMESTINAVHNEDTAVINDIPVEFRGRKGRFVLTKGFCDVRDMDFSDDDIAILSAGIIDGIENIKVDCSTNAEHSYRTKSGKIKTKTFSKRRGCDKKVIEIDIVFKLHEESSFPPVKEVTSDDKCSIELILKSKAFRRIESYIKLLGQASELSQTIALGNQIKDLEQDHLRLCRTMNYDVDIPGFPSNNTQQYTAIKKALHSRFSLIQGPPGWVVNKLGDKAPKIVRMYASAYEYLDFPVPGRAIISSRSMRDAKSDVALNKNGMVLHHIIRSNGKPHAAQIQKFDKKFHADNLIIQENEKLPHDQRKPVKTRLQDIYEYKCLLHTATVEELDNYDVIFCTTSLAGNPRLLTATKIKWLKSSLMNVACVLSQRVWFQ